MGRLIYFSKDKNLQILVSFRNSSYDIKSISDFNSLKVHNVNKIKTYNVPLPKNEISSALGNLEQNYPEYLFDEAVIKDQILILTYNLRKPKNVKEKPTKVINLDLKKYKD